MQKYRETDEPAGVSRPQPQVENVEEPRSFELFLAQISAKYLNLPVEEIDQQAEEDFIRLGRFLEVDRCGFHPPGPGGFDRVYRSNERPFPGWSYERDTLMWPLENGATCIDDLAAYGSDCFEAMQYLHRKWSSEEVLIINDIDEPTEHARRVRTFYRLLGIKSSLSVPIMVSGRVLARIVVGATRSPRTWSDDIVPKLRLFGEVFMNALERKRSAQMQPFQRLLSEVSSKYINLPVDRIDDEAAEDFARLSRLLGIDRCVFHPPRPGQFDQTYQREKTPFQGWVYERDKIKWPLENGAACIADLAAEDSDCFEDLQYLESIWGTEEVMITNHRDEPTEHARRTRRVNLLLGIQSVISVPIMSSGQVVARLSAAATRAPRTWSDDIVPKLRLFGEVFMNTLERKRSEATLKESETRSRQAEEKYRGIFENAIEGIFTASPSFEFLTVNRSLVTMFGYDDCEQFLRAVKKVGDTGFFVNPDDCREFRRRIAEEDILKAFEAEYFQRDGKHIWISMNWNVVRGADGSILRYDGTLVDITERKKAEKELRAKSLNLEETNAALRGLLHNMEEMKKEMEEKMVSSIRTLVVPHVRKLAGFKLTEEAKSHVDAMEEALNNITSPFQHSLNQFGLTPREVQVARYVRDGYTTKEIVELMRTTKDAIDVYRYRIRRKLCINGTKTNLHSYLSSIH